MYRWGGRQRRVLAAAFLLWLLGGPLNASVAIQHHQVDTLTALYEAHYPTPLRWFNLEDDFYWVDGPRPDYDRDRGLHLVGLQPGEAVLLRMEAGAWLRLYPVARSTCEAEYSVSASDGSGLYLTLVPIPDNDPASLVFKDNQWQSRLVRIERNADCAGRGELAVFFSVEHTPEPIAPYRDEWFSTADLQRLHGTNDRDYRHFQVLRPNLPEMITIEGPRRMMLQTRLRYLDQAPRIVDAYTVRIDDARHGCCDIQRRDPVLQPSLLPGSPQPESTIPLPVLLDTPACIRCDQRLHFRFDIDTTVEYRNPVHPLTCREVTGRLETHYFDLPAGRHRLSLASNVEVYARLQALPDQDYLLPALNAPIPETRDMVLGQLPVNGAAQGVVEERFSRLEKARRLLRDNSLPDAALHASALLLEIPRQEAVARELHAEGRRILGRHSYFRNILPAKRAGESRTSLAHFTDAPLVPPTERHRRLFAQPWQAQALSSAIGEAYFTPLTTASCGSGVCAPQTDGLSFILPSRTARSQLRVLVDRDALRGDARFALELEGAGSFEFSASDLRLLPVPEYLPSRGEVALELLDSPPPLLFGTAALNSSPGLLTQAPLIRPAMAEIPLPAQVRNVHVRPLDGATGDLRIALQYRVGKEFQLMTSDYESALELLTRNSRLATFLGLLQPGSESGQSTTLWAVPLAIFDSAEALSQSRAAIGQLGFPLFERLNADIRGETRWHLYAGPFAGKEAAAASARSMKARLRTSAYEIGAPLQVKVTPSMAVRAMSLASAPHADHLKDLGQHWLPLLHLLDDRLGRFTAGLQAETPIRGDGASNTGADLTEAAQLMREGHWLEALARYVEAGQNADEALRADAVAGRFHALQAMGERFLAEQQLRAAVRYDESLQVRSRAADLLMHIYLHEGRLLDIESLLVTRILVEEAAQRQQLASELVKVLLQSGHAEKAITLGLLLYPCVQPLEAMTQAAYEMRDWVLFERLVERLEPQRQQYWQGYRWQALGEGKAARLAWEQAGAAGHEVLKAWTAAEELIASGKGIGARLPTAEVLQQWRRSQPGPHRWMPVSDIVRAHAGVHSQQVHARDLLLNAYISTPGTPVSLQVQGPVRIRLEARPLFRDSDADRKEGWLLIDVNGERRQVPVSMNREVTGILPYHNDYSGLGEAEYAVLELPAAVNEVRIQASNTDLAVKVESWRTALPLMAAPLTRIDWPWAGAGQLHPRLELGRACPWDSVETSPTKIAAGSLVCKPSDAQENLRFRSHADHQIPSVIEPLTPGLFDVESINETGRKRQRLVSLLWWAEQKPERLEQVLPGAEWLAQSLGSDPIRGMVMGRLGREQTWELIESVRESAGKRRVPLQGWQPSSEFFRVRSLFLPVTGADEVMLYPGQKLTANYRVELARQTRLDFELLELPHLPVVPARVEISMDEKVLHSFELGRPDTLSTRTVRLDPGHHALQVVFAEGYANQFLKVRLVESGPSIPGDRLQVERRSYHVSRPSEPVVVNVTQRGLYRIDEWVANGLQTQYRLVDSKQGPLVLDSEGQPERLFRVYRLRRRDVPQVPTPSRRKPLQVNAPRMHEFASLSCDVPCNEQQLELVDRFLLGGQEDGTWGWHMRLQDRAALDEVSGNAGTDGLTSLQLAMDYQQYDRDSRTYHKLEGAIRVPEKGGLTLSGRGWMDWYPSDDSRSLHLYAALYAHEGKSTDNVLSAYLSLRGELHASMGTRWRNTASATVFERLMRDKLAGDLSQVDEDAYTAYKATHQRGLRLADRISYQPWLDTRWYAQGSLTTNDDFNLGDADNAGLDLGWEQLLGSVSVDSSLRYRRYFTDDDRARGTNDYQWRTDVLADFWTSARRRWYVQTGFRLDLDNQDMEWGLGLGMHFSEGRYYRDFRPGEVDFRALRTRRLLAGFENNQLNEYRMDPAAVGRSGNTRNSGE